MSRRDLVLLFALALLLNAAAALLIREPGYLDDAYYFAGALRLARGQGFTEPYLWNYLGDPRSLPQPSHLYWMPLTSILGAVWMFFFGQSFAAARLPSVLCASLLPLLAYVIAWRTTRLRRHAVCAGLLTIVSGYYPAYWGTTDSFSLYGLLGSLALLLFGLIPETRHPAWGLALAAGAAAGLAHLTRADGLLLLMVGGGGLISRAWADRGGGLGEGRHSPRKTRAPRPYLIRPLALVVGGYLLVMLPWFARNLRVAGSPLGRGGVSTLWLIEYNDLFNYPANLSPARYLAAGWPIILAGKWEALVTNLQTIIAVQGMIFLGPFILLGLWRLRQQALYRPALVYAGLLYLVMTFAFTFPGPRGGLFHSSTALIPFYASAAWVGLDAAVDWAAARLPHWRPERAKKNFSGLALAAAGIFTLALALPKLAGWGGGGALFREIGAAIPGGAGVMSNNPPGVWIATGQPGIPLVNGGVPDLLSAADQFSVHYVLLDPTYPPGLADLYSTESGERLRVVKRWGEWKLFEITP